MLAFSVTSAVSSHFSAYARSVGVTSAGGGKSSLHASRSRTACATRTAVSRSPIRFVFRRPP